MDTKTYQSEYYQKRRVERIVSIRKSIQKRLLPLRKVVFEYLQTHFCVDCSESDFLVLDFDHVRGKKEFSVSAAVGESNKHIVTVEALKEEIAKCDVRCSNCHRRKTAIEQNSWRVLFGSIV